MMKCLALLGLSWGLASSSSRAEHRVALVIGDDAAVPRLEARGFRCEQSDTPAQQDLQRLIENWAGRTPVNGTALVYFAGESRDEQLIGSNDRGVPMQTVRELLEHRGGSRVNGLLVATPGAAAPALPPAAGATRAVSPPDEFVAGKRAGDEWVNARGMVFCWVPPGRITVGSPEGTPGRFPDELQRGLVIDRGFWIGKYELTRGQRLRNLGGRSIGTQKNHPIESLHWDDGSGMLRRFTEEERKAGRLPAGWQYALPSSDQWEYAARAGTSTMFYFGDDVKTLREHANFADKSFYDSGDIFSNHAHRTLDDGFVRLAPVGSFKPNPWGLHDVYGNVMEWCRDKAARGGGWVSLAQNCRSGYRDAYSSRNEQVYLGYRIVIQPNVPDPPEK